MGISVPKKRKRYGRPAPDHFAKLDLLINQGKNTKTHQASAITPKNAISAKIPTKSSKNKLTRIKKIILKLREIKLALSLIFENVFLGKRFKFAKISHSLKINQK